jgi:SAM-dependent methyltransferase
MGRDMEHSRHLDLGCGSTPRNPHGRDLFYVVDIEPAKGLDVSVLKKANLAREKIPFADSFFESVSAYDFLEHIPRTMPTADSQGLIFPFVELMNEIWRVLRPDGMFHAQTPAYPRPEAFQDPTHCNIITDRTHRYFIEPGGGASVYGFTGCFRVKRVKWIRPKYDFEPTRLTARQALRKIVDILKDRNCHLLWELQAVK